MSFLYLKIFVMGKAGFKLNISKHILGKLFGGGEIYEKTI